MSVWRGGLESCTNLGAVMEIELVHVYYLNEYMRGYLMAAVGVCVLLVVGLILWDAFRGRWK